MILGKNNINNNYNNNNKLYSQLRIFIDGYRTKTNCTLCAKMYELRRTYVVTI